MVNIWLIYGEYMVNIWFIYFFQLAQAMSPGVRMFSGRFGRILAINVMLQSKGINAMP